LYILTAFIDFQAAQRPGSFLTDFNTFSHRTGSDLGTDVHPARKRFGSAYFCKDFDLLILFLGERIFLLERIFNLFFFYFIRVV